jgi:uncharacterized membrane protein YcaP (DUF421 family)
MDPIIRALVVYLSLLVIFRIAGKRSLSQVTTFDLLLTLIISEAIQEALVDDDHSLTQALILVVSLVSFDILLSLMKRRWPLIQKLTDETPVLIMQDGRVLEQPLRKERVDTGDILHAARERLGISRLDQLDHAVIESSGGITVIPKRPRSRRRRAS